MFIVFSVLSRFITTWTSSAVYDADREEGNFRYVLFLAVALLLPFRIFGHLYSKYIITRCYWFIYNEATMANTDANSTRIASVSLHLMNMKLVVARLDHLTLPKSSASHYVCQPDYVWCLSRDFPNLCDYAFLSSSLIPFQLYRYNYARTTAPWVCGE